MMGPSGSGKSYIGAALARDLGIDPGTDPGADFVEGDAFHPPHNIAKMTQGTPLDDSDRAAWIDAVERHIGGLCAPVVVLACSALTTYVQDRLRQMAQREVHFVLLQAAPGVLARRMRERGDHFMPASLLPSQIASLSAPRDAICVDASAPVAQITARIRAELDRRAQDQRDDKAGQPDQS